MSNQNPEQNGRLPTGVTDAAGRSEMTLALANMSNILDILQGGFTQLEESAEIFARLPSRSQGNEDKIPALSQQIADHDTDRTFNQIKLELSDEITRQVTASVKSRAPDWIRDEVSRQVKEQVDIQITEHLPETLQQQADESKRQVDVIRISLQNSESRMANSFIQTTNLSDPLAPILTSQGTMSPLYPPNTRCLLGYDLESAKGLNKDYELSESEDLSTNLQQFLKHIGTGVEVVVPN